MSEDRQDQTEREKLSYPEKPEISREPGQEAIIGTQEQLDLLSLSNISEEELTQAELNEWLLGGRTDLPEKVNKMMNNLILKLSVGLGVQVVASLDRINHLNNYMRKAEEIMFDVTMLDSMEESEIRRNYKIVASTSSALQEFQRKFIAQNRETLSLDNTPQQKLMDQIMSLPPDKIGLIMEMIRNTQEEAISKNVKAGQERISKSQKITDQEEA